MAKNRLDPKDVENLAQLRDQLKVHAHLFKAEVKDEWRKLEKDWRKMKSSLVAASRATGESAGELKAAGGLFVDSMKQGYRRIKRTLPH